MTAIDVANAIRNQNLDAPAGQIGQPPIASAQGFQLPIDTLGRLTDPEQFGDIIVKVGLSRPVTAGQRTACKSAPGDTGLTAAPLPASASTPPAPTSSRHDERAAGTAEPATT